MTQSTTRFRPGVMVWLFVLLYAGLAVQFAFATPVFEAPDEPQHFAFVHSVANRWRLPNQNNRGYINQGWMQEGSQPPLFYTLAALAAFPFDRRDLSDLMARNPHAQTGNPGALINRNTMRKHEPYPLDFSGAAGAVYAVRLLNAGFGMIAVWAVWKAARVIAPERPLIATLACGLTALNPQFAFIGGAVNNDMLAAALGSLIIWRALVMLRDGFSLGNSLGLAFLVALASLTKLSGLAFGVLVGVAAIWRWRRHGDHAGFFTLAVCGIGIWLIAAGPWYARNVHLYGDLLGTSRMIAIVGPRPEPLGMGTLVRELSSLSMSYWGVFGWFNVLTPLPYYTIVDLVLIASVIGLAVGLWRIRRDLDAAVPWLWLMLAFGVGLAALVAWTLQTYGTQGRLLFPYNAAITLLIAFGLTRLRIPERMRLALSPAAVRAPVWILLVALGVFAYAMPLGVIVPIYSPLPSMDKLPPYALAFNASWNNQIGIVGHNPIEGAFRPGDLMPVTIYWKPLIVSDRDYSIYLHVIDPDARIVGQIDSFPSGGLRRTSAWMPGEIYPDVYQIRLIESISEDVPLRLQIGWYDSVTGERLQAYAANGDPAPYVMMPAGQYSP